MNRISKKEARERFNKGLAVYLLPSKAVVGSMWIQPMMVTNGCNRDFEVVINEFRYYNCSKETGKAVHYYA